MSISPISQTEFVAFIRFPVNIPPIILPDTDASIPFAYQMAVDTVHLGFLRVSSGMYKRAVYNLGVDILINVAQDQPNRNELKEKRNEYKIHGFVPGVISTSSNAGTAESLVNPEIFKGFQLGDLQNLKTPWGRAYLAIASSVGTNWGLT